MTDIVSPMTKSERLACLLFRRTAEAPAQALLRFRDLGAEKHAKNQRCAAEICAVAYAHDGRVTEASLEEVRARLAPIVPLYAPTLTEVQSWFERWDADRRAM